MTNTITLPNGYDRHKNREMLTFRRVTMSDVDSIYQGQRIWFDANDHTAKQVTITSIKRWQKPSKTRNYTIQFGVKYGMYEFDHWRNCGCGDDDISRFLIPV